MVWKFLYEFQGILIIETRDNLIIKGKRKNARGKLGFYIVNKDLSVYNETVRYRDIKESNYVNKYGNYNNFWFIRKLFI